MWSAVYFPHKTWTFEAVVVQQRPGTKKTWCTCKLSCCFANLNLLFYGSLLSPSYLLKLPTVWRLSNHLCFKSCPKDVPNSSQGHTWVAAKPLQGPIASHYKTPILPFGLGMKAFCFFSDNVFWNSCIRWSQARLNRYLLTFIRFGTRDLKDIRDL